MSGSLAARYIAGLPYDPSLGVGAYSRAPRAPASSGASQVPGGALTVPTDATGQVVRVQPGAVSLGGPGVDPVTLFGGGGATGGGEGSGLLLAAALGLLPYLPDAYNAIGDLVGQGPASAQVQQAGAPTQVASGGLDAGTFTGPGGVAIPNAALGGLGTNWDSVFEPGSWAVDDAATQALLDAPMPAGDQFAGAAGDVAAANAGATPGVGGALGAADDPFYGSLGENPLFGGDLATGLAGAGGAALGGLISAQAPWTRQGYGAIGQQAGSAIGGIGAGALIGSALGPIGTAFGALAGSLIGGFGGGAAGSQIGPAPTVGRNFSSIGTFGGDGGLSWGNSGGDNGASAADADPFANWFAQNLQQQAAAQGLAFNPNMAGAQIRVGGYDNFNRTGLSPAGGYFYDITNQGGQFGGSPEQYALRPSDDFASDPFSARQADAFTTNVLADLAARNVFTPGGAATGGQGDLMGTLGTGYGWYGGLGSDYSQIEYGGSGGFNDILGGRQNAITGYMNAQQQQARQAAAVANTAQGFTDQGYVPAAFDLSQPIWFNGGIVNPGDILFPTQAASSNPWGAVGVDAGLIAPGLFGQQADGGA